ncbi:MAG: ComF family protein [Ferruginibacter sp.]
MQLLKTIFSDTLHLFYPHVCTGCGSDLLQDDQLLCLRCITNLPHTNFARHANNPIEKLFWGRMALVAAHSEFYFAKDSLIQHLIHQLKYRANQEIGIYLGELMGQSLVNSNRFKKIDYLIPLPLYPDKERKRGYNQAAVICTGLSGIMNVPVLQGNVTRQRFTETQTKKHRTERWENVADSFLVNDKEKLYGKNLLLIDDVLTTGATLEACGQSILQADDVKLSIATLSMATN